jgi:hypothetical protein
MENQFHTLQEWIGEVLHPIKKDIKSEHLGSDMAFYRNYFGNRPQNRLTAEEIVAAYEKELLKGNEDLGSWIVNRWVFKHGDLYQHFAERLERINPDFDQIEEMTESQARDVLEGSEAFGPIAVYLFAVLNGVVFPKRVVEELKGKAEEAKKERGERGKREEEDRAVEKEVLALQREIARLNDKIAGVQKKYETDTGGLKKQIKALQKRLNG